MTQVMAMDQQPRTSTDEPWHNKPSKGFAVLPPFDEQYPTFGPQPDARFFAIPEHVDVTFTDTFKAPDTHRSFKSSRAIDSYVIQKGYGTVFTFCVDCVYYAFVFIIGFFLTLMWAWLFGIMSFFTVWFIQPMVKCLYTNMRVCGNVYSACIRTFLDPCCQAAGLCSSYFRLRLNIIGDTPRYDLIRHQQIVNREPRPADSAYVMGGKGNEAYDLHDV